MELFFTGHLDKTMLFYAANIVYCFAYMVTSMVWLRVLTILAAIYTFLYFYFWLEPLWSALLWQSVFVGINLVNLCLLLFAIRPQSLTLVQRQLHHNVFKDLKSNEVV